MGKNTHVAVDRPILVADYASSSHTRSIPSRRTVCPLVKPEPHRRGVKSNVASRRSRGPRGFAAKALAGCAMDEKVGRLSYGAVQPLSRMCAVAGGQPIASPQLIAIMPTYSGVSMTVLGPSARRPQSSVSPGCERPRGRGRGILVAEHLVLKDFSFDRACRRIERDVDQSAKEDIGSLTRSDEMIDVMDREFHNGDLIG